VAWPASSLAYQPGLRLGFSDSSRSQELFLDSGMFLLDEAGSSLSLFVSSLGYQRAFRFHRSIAAIANATCGLYREGGGPTTSTALNYGAGFGIRYGIHDGHGVLRAELRADHLEQDESVSRPALTSIGLRFGFDLWL